MTVDTVQQTASKRQYAWLHCARDRKDGLSQWCKVNCSSTVRRDEKDMVRRNGTQSRGGELTHSPTRTA